ncbi:MAG: efflux RND transporter permease subunit [Marinicellaceae bacterium]
MENNSSINSHERGIIAWFANNPVAANLLMGVLILLGVFTGLNIRTEAFPGFAPNSISINVTYIGGSPSEVEEGVAIKIEESLEGLEGVKEITSQVSSNSAQVSVTAEEGFDLKELKDEIKLRVDSITNFPDQAERPVIKEQIFERNVLSLELFGEADPITLKKTAERIKDSLLKLDAVNKIDINGVKNYEISIEVSEQNLQKYNLSMEQIADAIRKNSVNLSSGSLVTDSRNINIKTEQQAYTGEQFSNIIILENEAGGQLRLSEIANIIDGVSDEKSFSRFNGKPSVQLQIKLLSNDSITKAAQAIKQNLQGITSSFWFPKTIETKIWNDESQVINDRLSLMIKNAITGILLVLVMLALFLNIKVAFWVAIGIPIAFAGALFLMGPLVADYSLNVLTTFGFIVVLGIVVDDAIVIGENVYSYKQKYKGRDIDPVKTTIIATQNVAVPATFGVLTTVAAFFPLTLIESQFGEIFGSIASIVIFCLLFSLVESKWILPAHLAHIKLEETNEKSYWNRLQSFINTRLNNFIANKYTPLLKSSIRNKFLSLCVFAALFVFTVGLVPSGLVRMSFFPDIEAETSVADLELQSGLGSKLTDSITQQIENAAFRVNNQSKDLFNTDEKPIASVYSFSSGNEKSKTYIQLTKNPERIYTSQDVVNAWRKEIGEISGVKSLEIYALGPGSGSDLSIELSSSNYIELANAAEQLKSKVASYSGVYDVKSSYDEGSGELQLELTDLAYSLGLTYNDVARQVRYAIYGFEVQRIQRGTDEVKVKVRYPEEYRNNISDLQQFRIQTSNGDRVPFGLIATTRSVQSLSNINRIDKKRVVYVSGRIDKQKTSTSEVISDVNDNYLPELKASFPDLEISLGGASREQNTAVSSLLKGFLLSLILIYSLLAIPLKSYLQPLMIMSVIPFGIIGAIVGHYLIGIPLGLLSFFGILALSGVVVNDSLVLVNRYNEIKSKGKDYYEAITKAAQSRFRAIFLTSVTTFMGLSPLVFETSLQAQFLIPMAVSLAFGILFATLITLIVVPVLIGVLEQLKGNINNKSKERLNEK